VAWLQPSRLAMSAQHIPARYKRSISFSFRSCLNCGYFGPWQPMFDLLTSVCLRPSEMFSRGCVFRNSMMWCRSAAAARWSGTSASLTSLILLTPPPTTGKQLKVQLPERAQSQTSGRTKPTASAQSPANQPFTTPPAFGTRNAGTAVPSKLRLGA
jgi:hypothetical protein